MAVATALNVISQRNPLYSALSLIGTLASLSALYLTLHAQFIAAIQIVVYAGAIMVLFIFVIMLLNVPKTQPVIEKHKALGYLAIPFAGALIAEAFYVLQKVADKKISPVFMIDTTDRAVGTTYSVGQLFVFIVMTVAAAEAAVGLAIIISIFRNRETLNVDEADTLKL